MVLPNPNEEKQEKAAPVSRQAQKLTKIGDAISREFKISGNSGELLTNTTAVAFDAAIQLIQTDASKSMKHASPEQRRLFSFIEEALIDLRHNTDITKHDELVKRLQKLKGRTTGIEGSSVANKFMQKLVDTVATKSKITRRQKAKNNLSNALGMKNFSVKSFFDVSDIKFKEDSVFGDLMSMFGLGTSGEKVAGEVAELQGEISQRRRDIGPRANAKKKVAQKARYANPKPTKAQSEPITDIMTDSKTGVSYAKVGDTWKAVDPKGQAIEPQGSLTKYRDTPEDHKTAVKESKTSMKRQTIDQNNSVKATKAQSEPIVKRATSAEKLKISSITVDNIIAKNITVGTPKVSTPSSGKTVSGNKNPALVGLGEPKATEKEGGLSVDLGMPGKTGTAAGLGSSLLRGATKAAPYAGTLIAGAYGLYNASEIQEREAAGELTENEAFEEQSGNLGMVMGAGAGAAFGAGVGAAFGGVGAIPGAIIGGVVGGIAGTETGKTIGKYGKKAYEGIKGFLGYGEETEDEYVEKRTKELMADYPEEARKDKKLQAEIKKKAIFEFRDAAKAKAEEKKANEPAPPVKMSTNQRRREIKASRIQQNQAEIEAITNKTNNVVSGAATEVPAISKEIEASKTKAATPTVIMSPPAAPQVIQQQSQGTIIPVRASVRPNESAFEKYQDRVFSG